MDRRLILLGLAAAGVAGPALAQTTAPMPMTPSAAPTAGGAAMGQAEMDHAKRTALAGTATLQASDMALEKARNAKVKEFAKFEHDEQTTIAEILMSMDPGMKPMPDPKMADTLAKLKGMQAGAAFDKEYVAAQIAGHKVLLDIQEDYLKVGKNREHVSIAKLARGQIKEHLALLDDLQKMS